MGDHPRQVTKASVDVVDIEGVLWAVCGDDCESLGRDAVSSIAFAVAKGVEETLTLPEFRSPEAAVKLIACATFTRAVARAYAGLAQDERRKATALMKAVDERAAVADAYALARCFIAQVTVC